MWTKLLIFMIVFFLVASPATFKIMRRLLGAWVASADGVATSAGLLLHGAVFVALVMYIPRALMTFEEFKEYDKEARKEAREAKKEAKTVVAPGAAAPEPAAGLTIAPAKSTFISYGDY